MPKIKTTCAVCGKEIYRWPYQLRDFTPCCSAECRRKFMLGSIPPSKANLIGQKFNMLTVIECAGSRKGHALWKCKCDCGKETFVTTGSLRYGAVKSCGCLLFRRGEKHPNWKQGYNITPYGYMEIPENGSRKAHRYKSEHRTIMENILGRKLNNNEVIHHINQDKLDNRLENLVVMTRQEHATLHAQLRREEHAKENR